MARQKWLMEAVQRGKYAALYIHLSERNDDEWNASFVELESVLGFALPKSARMYRPWWANAHDGGHSQALAWTMAGWNVGDVDLEGETMRFFRGKKSKSTEAVSGLRTTPPKMIDFHAALQRRLNSARACGEHHATINAGELHRDVGGYPTPFNRMQMCCNAMYQRQRPGDVILSAPPKKYGASLTLLYQLSGSK